MSEAAATAHHEVETSTGVENKKVLMWLFLASDCMFFGTLISTHLIYRKIYLTADVDPTKIFDIELTTASTFILLMSSFLMALAVSAMHKGEIKSYRRNVAGVIFFGLIFLGAQVYEFHHFYHAYDLSLTNSLFGSTFYVLTGTHGTHVAIGVLWLFGQLCYSYTPKFNAHKSAIDVETAGLYWHFVDIVWLIIFPAIYLIEYV